MLKEYECVLVCLPTFAVNFWNAFKNTNFFQEGKKKKGTVFLTTSLQ